MNIEDMNDKEYRHGLVAAQIEVDIPLQIRALRQQRKWTQPKLASEAEMKQPRISAMEKPGEVHFTIETLKRVAEAFDVALIVRFAPFSELTGWSRKFDPDSFSIPSFGDEQRSEASTPATSNSQVLKSPVGNALQQANYFSAAANALNEVVLTSLQKYAQPIPEGVNALAYLAQTSGIPAGKLESIQPRKRPFLQRAQKVTVMPKRGESEPTRRYQWRDHGRRDQVSNNPTSIAS